MTFSPNLTYVFEKVDDRVKSEKTNITPLAIGDLDPGIKVV